MNDEKIRFECLRVALGYDLPLYKALPVAEKLSQFVRGERKASELISSEDDSRNKRDSRAGDAEAG